MHFFSGDEFSQIRHNVPGPLDSRDGGVFRADRNPGGIYANFKIRHGIDRAVNGVWTG